MMACGAVSYVALSLTGALAFVLVVAVCAVVLAHRSRVIDAGRDPFLGIMRADGDALIDERFRKSQQ